MKKTSAVHPAIILISVLVILAIFLFALPYISCNKSADERERFISSEKAWYANWMRFMAQIERDGIPRIIIDSSIVEVTNPYSDAFLPYTELIFIYNNEDVIEYPDYILVAWPDETRTERVIEGIHKAVNRTEEDMERWSMFKRAVITLEEFGLSYPITFYDVVDQWEKVNNLINALTIEERVLLEYGNMD